MKFLCLLPLLVLPVLVQAEDEYEQAPIRYSETQPRDAAQALEKMLLAGKVKIDRTDAWSVLRGVLKCFGIPEESQVMVFSKTSKQNDRRRLNRSLHHRSETRPHLLSARSRGGVLEAAAFRA
jgi:hypothetical protein